MRAERDYATALAKLAAERPDGVPYRFRGAALTSGELFSDARRIAAGLRAAGVLPGDRVAMLLPAGFDFVRGFAAVASAGAIPFGIPAEIAAETALSRASRGLPALLLTSEARREELLAARDAAEPFAIASLERLREAPGDAALTAPPPVDPVAPAFLQFTSGTTGEPRLAALPHRALDAWRGQTAGVIDNQREDVLVGWVPPWHVMGMVRFVLQPVFSECVAHLVPPKVATLGEWLETIERTRATFSSAPDFALRTAPRLLPARRLDLSSLRALVSGGEPVRLETIRAFESRFGLSGVVRPAYGLAEATLAVTALAPGEPLRVDGSGNVSCGRPLPGVELRIVDPSGREAAEGAPGEIQIRSAALFSGYFTAAGLDRSAVADGWLATGDVGRLGSAGELYVLGRRRNLLKHGGATYAPRELEEVAERVDGVWASAAIALTDAGRGTEVAVVVVESAPAAPLASDAPAGLARAVAEEIRRALGLLPGEVLVVTPGTLPRTENGKLRHLELRRRLAAGELEGGALLFGRADGWTVEQAAE